MFKLKWSGLFRQQVIFRHTYVNRFGIAASGGVDLSPYSKNKTHNYSSYNCQLNILSKVGFVRSNHSSYY